MHHHRVFVQFGKPSYLRGEISHIDFCNPDEISLIEGTLACFYSTTGVNETNGLFMLKDAIDVMNLHNFIDENRMVGIFVNHENLLYPVVDEDEHIESMRLDPDVINSNESSSRGEKLNDSECDMSDDMLFESNIDAKVEGGWLSSREQTTNIREQSNVGSQGSEGGAYIHRGHPIFNTRADASVLKFKLGMCFNDAATFRQAVRQYSMNHDICHLKTCFGGILLCEIGIEANNGMPFAYAIVEKEKRKSWGWFLQLLAENLNISNPYHWTFVSDKQNRLVESIESLFLGFEHRFYWELNGIPCAHAICAMYYMNYSHKDYVDRRYKKETFLIPYSNLLGTINGSDMWPRKGADESKSNLAMKKKIQIKLGKKGVVMTCLICQKKNHNARGYRQRKNNQIEDEGLDILTPVSAKGIKRKHKEQVSEITNEANKKRKAFVPEAPIDERMPRSIANAISHRVTRSKATTTSQRDTLQRVTRSTIDLTL
ncbi:hypothetical protein CDL12_17801 [Handroanthus impetiginosus]|uniref:Zinc finger PMZ-type domain-containing protein n=1 Tax=Handroanthus impetiginosus TaxID=429701 RepID=A0A2G9GWH0_9LAMI|nr:hypothetical protein CDL12_17801 [Handroanthus impetiginosus]